MTKIFYSAKNNAFFIEGVHTIDRATMQEISPQRYQEMMAAQGHGAEIVGNPGTGLPERKSTSYETPSLEQVRAKRVASLWIAYKNYQRSQVDPEDLTLAAQCAASGSLKGAAVQQWVLQLWGDYYKVKMSMLSAESNDVLMMIPINPARCGTIPYSIAELNLEAAESMRNL